MSSKFLVSVFLFGLSLAPLLAHGDIFVSYGNAVGQYSNSGVPINLSLIATGLVTPWGIAVSNSDLFVANYGNGTVGEFTTAGELLNASLISGLINPRAVVVSGDDLFVTYESNDEGRAGIAEYTTSGQTINASLITLPSGELPYDVAISGTDIFVAMEGSNQAIGEYTTSGAAVNPLLITGLSAPTGVAVSGSDLFVVDNDYGTVGEYTLSGVPVNKALIAGLDYAYNIAAFDSDLVVANYAAGTVNEYTTSGAIVNSFVASGFYPKGITVTPEPAASSIGLALLIGFLRRRRQPSQKE